MACTNFASDFGASHAALVVGDEDLGFENLDWTHLGDGYGNVNPDIIICSNQLNVRTCELGHWSWRTPCAVRIACQTTTVPSRPLRDFPNPEQLGTTVTEHSSSLPLSTSPELTLRRDSM